MPTAARASSSSAGRPRTVRRSTPSRAISRARASRSLARRARWRTLRAAGRGYDLASAEDGRLGVTFGRHCGDWVTSFYTWTPSAFMVEYGWGARSIDVASWQPSERKEGPSLWGHDRAWLAPELREE